MTAQTSTAGEGLLRVEDVFKSYPTPAEPLEVLRGVSFEVRPGGSAAIMGPSGSGKTTLLHIIGTLDQPTSGRVTLNGVDPFALDPKGVARFRAESVGFVFQDHHLLPQLTALENVTLACLARGRVKREDEERAAGLLERVGLANRADHRPAELSGGERQRVAIARALVNRPHLLLCDEPTGNLDEATADAVGTLLADLAADLPAAPAQAGLPAAGRWQTGAMVVVVTHSRRLAARFDRQLVLHEGRLMEGRNG